MYLIPDYQANFNYLTSADTTSPHTEANTSNLKCKR